MASVSDDNLQYTFSPEVNAVLIRLKKLDS